MLPSKEDWPFLGPVPGEDYPDHLNASIELLDVNLENGLGDRPAIYQTGDAASTTSYSELARRVDSLAASFSELGLEKGDRVLLRLPNGLDFVSCWLAILRLGGVAVPTLPLLGSQELEMILADCRPKMTVCQDYLLEPLKAARLGSSVLLVSAGEAEVSPHSLDEMASNKGSLPPVLTAADDLALLLYTSGSTGRPKGAAHFHRDILAVADCYSRNILNPNQESVFGGPPSLAFAFGLGALLIFPLRAGGATVLGEYLLPAAVVPDVRKFGITHFFGSPSFFRLLLQTVKGSLREWLGSLEIAVSAGESLPGQLLEEWTEKTGVPILDGMGTTELLHIFLSTRVSDALPDSLGTAVPGYEVKIVDDRFEELPPGELGQLAVRGSTGCLYWNLPAEQKKYVRYGWNLTGDLCTKDSDGHVQYQCRRDDLIISGGQNVDPLEVENALLELEGVEECAVIGRAHPQLSQIPVAVIVPSNTDLTPDQLLHTIRQGLQRRLAPFKIPRQVELVEELPRTATGKLRRSLLRKP